MRRAAVAPVPRAVTDLQMRRAVVCAVIGWAYCGALIGVGRQFMIMDHTLVMHAMGAPLGFGVVSWLYHRWIRDSQPLTTAAVFLAVVVLLDVIVIALLVERSFAMFRSVLGTWLPFALIFVATYLVGLVTVRRSRANEGAPA